MSPDRPHIDLLLRYSAGALGAHAAIGAHQRVASEEGSVCFGKIGQALAVEKVQRMNKQIESGDTTFLYVVTRVGQDLFAHRGEMVKVTHSYHDLEPDRVPEYYDELGITSDIKTWIEVQQLSLVNERDLREIKNQTSKRPVFGSLLSGSRSFFYVQ